ncbi:MAG: amino acid adenylation domain-containing protein, partial [Bacillota bacterium]|nr:amino acid adenylation domain-containing protein [Bacillota bacterium]
MTGNKLLPLSAQQKGIWYLEQTHPNTSIGVISGTLKFRGNINYYLLEQAMNAYLESDDSIRTRITLVDDEPMQYTADFKPQKVDFFDFSLTGREGLFQWDMSITQAPFKLIDTDLFYFAIIKMDENEGGILIKLHHIISDAWSIVLSGNNVMRNYMRLLCGEEPDREMRPTYAEYLEHEEEYSNSKQYEKDRLYWSEVVKDLPDQLGIKEYNLSQVSTVGKRKAYVISDKLATLIRQFCAEHTASTFSVFFSVLAVYIYRLTGRMKLAFGTPVYNRRNERERNTVGMFVSTVPMIVDINDEMNFIEFNRNIISNWMQTLRHQKYPYEKILQEARRVNGPIKRLYEIAISYQNAQFVRGDNYADKQEGRWHFNGHQIEPLCIHVSERDNDGKILLDYDYLAQVFNSKEIEYIHNHIINLLSDALEYPDKRLREIEILEPEEKRRILEDFNRTGLDYDRMSTVHQIIEEQAAIRPNDTAIVFDGREISYRELNMRAGKLAFQLKALCPEHEQAVAIMAKRSPDIIIAMLAVLKAGGAFLPIDPEFPNSRISYMLSNAGVEIVLSQSAFAGRFKGKDAIGYENNIIWMDEDKDLPAYHDIMSASTFKNPCGLAYIIYTSGSTGDPKGVMVEHRSLVNFNAGMKQVMEFEPGSAAACITTVSFDVFILETLPTLMNGMRIVIADEEEQKDPRRLAALLQEHNIKKMYLTPSRLRTLLTDENFTAVLSGLTELVCGGEQFPQDLIRQLRSVTKAKIYNQYGPTEATIGVTIKQFEQLDTVNIGKPMANVHIYILDSHMNVLPIGVPGEMYIGGECLARGYIGMEEQTKESFIPSPFNPDERLYRTGDLTRWYPRGEIAFLGRVDQQVKIRGYRIELKEIENKIKKHMAVENAVVIDRKDSSGNQYLCSYVVSEEDIPVKEMKEFLSQQLPHYMIPTFNIRLESIPLTPNGKVDFARLPEPKILGERGQEYVAASNTIESELVNIWQKVLGLDTIGVTDDYFDLGGDSLNVIMMTVEIHRVFNVDLMFTDVYQSPTIRQLAETIKNAKQEQLAPLLPAHRMESYPLSAAQRRLFILDSIDQNKLAYNMPGAFYIRGPLDISRLQQAFQMIIDRHEILRTCFEVRGGEAVQIVLETVPFALETLPEGQLDNALCAFIRPFDLSRPPLIRAGTICISPDEHLLLVDMHHIISDGATAELMMQELNILYQGGVPQEVKHQYKDYVIWSRTVCESQWMLKQRDYWDSVFSDGVPVLDLPTDHPRKPAMDFIGKKIRFSLDKETAAAVTGFCRSRKVTLYMFFLSIWNMLLSRMSGQEDIVVGTPALGRRNAELSEMIGIFINMLPMRNQPCAEKTYEQFLAQLRENVIAALDNQDYPFDLMVDRLPVARDISRNPVFDTMFVLQTVNAAQMKLGDLHVEPVELDTGITKLDILLEAMEHEGTIDFSLEYASSLFDASTMKRYARYFINLIRETINKSEQPMHEIQCMDEKDRELLIHQYNNTAAPYREATIDALFDEQAAKTPEKTAVVFHDRKVSYAELKSMADGIASRLAEQGIGDGCVVGLLFHRSVEMMASMLAVMKTGAAYMPIDPGYPEERMMYMLEDSCSPLALFGRDTRLPEHFTGKSIYVTDEIPKNAVFEPKPHDAKSCIYVLYTSGSTGRPKGVMIAHRSVANL